MLEKELEAWARDYARQRGALLLKWVSPGRAGVPDRVLITTGGVAFVEFKRPGGKLTKLQRVMIQKIEQAGGNVYVIDNKPAFAELFEAVSAGRYRSPL